MSKYLYSSQSARTEEEFARPRNHTERVHDSDDELDDIGTEDNLLFQKVPESIVKTKINAASAKKLNQEHPNEAYCFESPMKEVNANTKQHTGSLNSDEFLKKILYNISPRDAVNEYMRKTQHKSMTPTLAMRSLASPTKSKNFPYTFNSPTKHNQENLEENKQKQGPSKDQPVSYTGYSERANRIYNSKFNSESKARRTDLGVLENQSLLLGGPLQRKQSATSKEAQEALTSRLAKEGEVRSEHNKVLTASYLMKELKECTFTPKTLNDKPRRNFEEFLEDQKNFVSQTELKKRKLQEEALIAKAQEEASYKPSYKPEINPNSAKIAKKKNDTSSVHHRLFNDSRGVQKRLFQSPTKGYSGNARSERESMDFVGPISVSNENNRNSSVERPSPADEYSFNFKPNIQARNKSIKRKDKVEDILYNDAIRRQNKKIEEVMRKQSPQSSTKSISDKSKKALARRFIKEFDVAILGFLEKDSAPKLNYVQLDDFLKKLNFLKETQQTESPRFTPERQLLQQMWNIMSGEKTQGIHRRNLLVFLLGVLDLYFPITKIQPNMELSKYHEHESGSLSSLNMSTSRPHSPSNVLQQDRKAIGTFDANENYLLTEEEVSKLHKMFELFYLNRLRTVDSVRQYIKNKNLEDYSYRPEINKSSKNLAQMHRDRILDGTAELMQQNKIPVPRDGKMTHADLLIASKKVTEERIRNKEQVVRENEAADCTFKPQTKFYDCDLNSSDYESLNYQSKNNSLIILSSPKREELSRPRAIKRDKEASEIEYERNQGEYTFKPTIYAKRDGKSSESDRSSVKGAEKMIGRLRKAQNEREQQRMRNQSGVITGDEKNFVFGMRRNKSEKDTKKASVDNEEYIPAASMQPDVDGKSPRIRELNGASLDYSVLRSNDNDKQDRDEEFFRPFEIETEEKSLTDQRIESNRVDEAFKRHLEEYDDHQERVPLLFIDVNISHGKTDRIVVFEGDTAEELAQSFSELHGLHPSLKGKLKALLDTQLAGILTRIDEEANSMHSDTERSINENV